MQLNVDPKTFRSSVWRAAWEHFVRYGTALSFVDIPVIVRSAGLIVWRKSYKGVYCDGRVYPVHIATDLQTRDKVLFLPFPTVSKPLVDEPTSTDQEMISQAV